MVAACTACWCRCARVRSCSEGAHSDVDGAGALERLRLLERERCGGSLGGASSDEVMLQAMKVSCSNLTGTAGCKGYNRIGHVEPWKACLGEILHAKILSFQNYSKPGWLFERQSTWKQVMILLPPTTAYYCLLLFLLLLTTPCYSLLLLLSTTYLLLILSTTCCLKVLGSDRRW